jgi:hypothetical protein
MAYGCGKCSGTAFDVQMRKVLVTVGPTQELQVAGIVPARVCLNEKCKQITVHTNLQIGDAVDLVPAPSKQMELPALDEGALTQLQQALGEQKAEEPTEDAPVQEPPTH